MSSFSKSLQVNSSRFKPGKAVAELRKITGLPKIRKPSSLRKLMQGEKTAAVFIERFGEVLNEAVSHFAKGAAGGLRPAYSNPFAGYQSRGGYGSRGEHAVPHSDPFKWNARPGAKDPQLSGLAEKARASRQYRDEQYKKRLQQGTQAFGKAMLGGVRGGVPGAVVGGVLGAPLGPLGVAGGATAGGLLGGTIGAGMSGGGKMVGQQFLRDIGFK